MVATLGAIITSGSLLESRSSTRLANNTRAFWMAEAGLQRAVWEVKQNGCKGMKNQETGFMCSSCIDCGTGNKLIFRSLPAGEYEATVDENNTTVISGGYFPAQQGPHMYRVVKVDISGAALFGYGAFSREGLSLGNGVQTDSYDSQRGGYNVGGNKAQHGDIGTNGLSVRIGNNSTVGGNVNTGAGGTVSSGNATITGTSTSTARLSIPPVIVPRSLVALDYQSPHALSVSGNTALTAGDYKYSSLSVVSGGTLSIDGAVRIYLTGADAAQTAFSIENNATFVIGSLGSLTLYSDGKIDIKANADINNKTEDASRLVIYSTFTGAGGVVLGSHKDVHAAIYAPNTEIAVGENANVFGSMLGRTVSVGDGSAVHYDTNLKNYSGADSVGAAHNWQEI